MYSPTCYPNCGQMWVEIPRGYRAHCTVFTPHGVEAFVGFGHPTWQFFLKSPHIPVYHGGGGYEGYHQPMAPVRGWGTCGFWRANFKAPTYIPVVGVVGLYIDYCTSLEADQELCFPCVKPLTLLEYPGIDDTPVCTMDILIQR